MEGEPMTLAVLLICLSFGGVAATAVWFSFDLWRVPQSFPAGNSVPGEPATGACASPPRSDSTSLNTRRRSYSCTPTP